jgi:hypothetical protein
MMTGMGRTPLKTTQMKEERAHKTIKTDQTPNLRPSRTSQKLMIVIQTIKSLLSKKGK